MSGNTSETRCKHCGGEEGHLVHHAGKGFKNAHKFEPTPPEGEAVPEQPFRKALTVIMFPDNSDTQADKDVDAVLDSSSTIFRQGVSELYFHQLRLRVAKDPTLAAKIGVFYADGAVMQCVDITQPQYRWPVGFGEEIWNKEQEIQKIKPVGLTFEDELKWPSGFLQELISKEIAIRKARKQILPAPVVSTAAPEPPDEICPNCQGVHAPKVVMSFVKPVAPESYKPAEGAKIHQGIWPICDWCGTELEKQGSGAGKCPKCGAMKFEPAATPVTVEAPENLAYQFKEELNAKLDAALATPKPIGDVEAVARKIYEASPVINGEVRPSFDEIIRILIPFFARISDKTLNAIVQDVAELPDRTSPDDWPEAMLVTAEELKAIISGNIEESAQPPCSECATPSDKWYMEYQAAVARAVQAEAECATLRKERDDAHAGLLIHERLLLAISRSGGSAKCWEKEFKESWAIRGKVSSNVKSLLDRAEAAEAQLSTLRDALRGMLESYDLLIEQAQSHFKSETFKGVIEGAFIGEITRARKLLAPTPEVAPESVKLVSKREPTEAEIKQGLELQPMAEECLKRNTTPEVAKE